MGHDAGPMRPPRAPEVEARPFGVTSGRGASKGSGATYPRRALVLNASYEPLSIVSSRRAVCLLLSEKAELVECDDAVVRSANVSIPVPTVVRLRYMVRVPRRAVAAVSRRAVFARDEYRCQYCGARADSIDHVVPRSRGGSHVWENLAAACRPCNMMKRDRTPDEAGMRLLRPCRAPRGTAWVTLGLFGVPEAWRPYLAIAS
jgi:5-methylcytosine-specific restriction endonuclease McrA